MFYPSHQTTNSILTLMPISSPDCYLNFWVKGYKSQAHTNPSSSSDLLEQLTELKRNTYLHLSVYFKQYYKGHKWAEVQRARYVRRGEELPYSLWAHQSPWIYVHQPRKSLNLILWVFMVTSLHRHDWLNHLPLMVELNLQPFSPSQYPGVGLKVPDLLVIQLVPLATNPHP